MKYVSLPLLTTEKDIEYLDYPEDIVPGMYVWDNKLKEAVLITDFTTADLHKQNVSNSRTRFATKKEILDQREQLKFPHVKYNTITKWRAFNYASVIYNF